MDRSDPDFALWVDRNCHPHKQPGYVSVTISLKPVGGIPGDASAADLVMSHASVNFDRSGFQSDWNVVFPLDRLRDLTKMLEEAAVMKTLPGVMASYYRMGDRYQLASTNPMSRDERR